MILCLTGCEVERKGVPHSCEKQEWEIATACIGICGFPPLDLLYFPPRSIKLPLSLFRIIVRNTTYRSMDLLSMRVWVLSRKSSSGICPLSP
jgi:hypothetical protein